jgi:plasmid stabilization system protein ParE
VIIPAFNEQDSGRSGDAAQVADRIRSVAWSRSAQAALDEAVSYINLDSPANAQRVLVAALAEAASLENFA